jgi:hypothetical protein
MRLAELFEARKNPKLNPKEEGHVAAAKFLNSVPASQIEKYGVSMTELPKLGVNPKSSYNTPLGIYSYPANYYEEIKSPSHDEDLPQALLPFQDEAPYIQIFKVNSGNILNLGKVDVDQYQTYTKKLFDLSETLATISGEDPGYVTDRISSIITKASTEANVKSYGGWLWYVLYRLSSALVFSIENRPGQAKRSPVLWNKLFRLLEIDAVLDDGNSIIHENEPFQFVVFDTSKIELVKTFTNSGSIKKEIPPWAKLYKDTQGLSGIKFIKYVANTINSDALYVDKESQKIAASMGAKAASILKKNPELFREILIRDIRALKSIVDTKELRSFLDVGYTLEHWYSMSVKYEKLLNLFDYAAKKMTPPEQAALANNAVYDVDVFQRIAATLRAHPPATQEVKDILMSIDKLIDAHAYISELGKGQLKLEPAPNAAAD